MIDRIRLTPRIMAELGKILASPVGIGLVVAVFGIVLTGRILEFGERILQQASISNDRLASIERTITDIHRQQLQSQMKLDLLQEQYILLRSDVDKLMTR